MCLGDSITIGSRSVLGYPEYCGQHLSEKTNKNWNVVNHAVAGFKAIDLARSITANFSNLKESKPEIISVLIGTNDLKSNTTISDFKIALQQVLIKAKLIIGNSNVIVLEIPPLMEGVMLPYKVSMNEQLKNFNQVINELSAKMGYSVKKMISSEEHFFDGVHLNSDGCKYWGAQLSELIIRERFSPINEQRSARP